MELFNWNVPCDSGQQAFAQDKMVTCANARARLMQGDPRHLPVRDELLFFNFIRFARFNSYLLVPILCIQNAEIK